MNLLKSLFVSVYMMVAVAILRTAIITDVGGRILWAHEPDNYRVRPDPDVYLAVLREKLS